MKNELEILCCLLAFSAALILAGCQPGQSSPTAAATASPNGVVPDKATASPTGAVPDTGNPVPPLPGVDATLTPPMQKLVALAQKRLADKYQKSPGDFRLFSIIPMNWPDSSLGCPQPALVYQPVITPGYQMVFESGSQTYVVHSDDQDTVILCAARAPDEIYPTP